MGQPDEILQSAEMTGPQILAAIDHGLRQVCAQFRGSSDGSLAENGTPAPLEAPSHRTVGRLLALAQNHAMAADTNIREQWIKGSSAAARFTGVSEIAFHIQELGQFDMLVRALENEAAADPAPGEASSPQITGFGLQVGLSRQWVLSAYEIVRTLSNKWKALEPQAGDLLRRLELVRIPLAKLQIAKDRALGKDGRLELVRRGDPPDKPGQIYTAKNPATYWPETFLNIASGSIVWDVIDLKNRTQAQILRLDLSNDFLRLLAAVRAEAGA